MEQEVLNQTNSIESKVINQTNDLNVRISSQTDKIIECASSLDSMKKADVINFYPSRNSAGPDILADIRDPSITKLRIIGISLNDFLRPGHPTFHPAWGTIEEYIKKGIPNQQSLDVKLLLIDPSCDGAYHRSKAEQTNSSGIPGRLENDVVDSIEALHKLIHLQRKNNVTFDVKIYRTPPILYLVQTDFVSYVQQYYFWRQHDPVLHIPVIKYQGRRSSKAQGASMHDELDFHFNYIWQNCSITLDDFLDKHIRGCDETTRNANMANMYYIYSKNDVCKKRISYIISETQKRLHIKGITLESLFRPGFLFDAFCSKIDSQPDLDVKILLIDPLEQQAKYRSFRELLIWDENVKYVNYNDAIHKDQPLYKDTLETIDNIRHFVKQCSIVPKISIHLYKSAPECFMLLTDQSVIVEQYHYGKIIPQFDNNTKKRFRGLLGKDIPVIEYSRPEGEDLHSQEKNLRNPYKIFDDHFDFVYEYCSREINISNILDQST